MKPQPHEPVEIDWHQLNPLCQKCQRDCKQCAAVSVVGCAKFVKTATGTLFGDNK